MAICDLVKKFNIYIEVAVFGTRLIVIHSYLTFNAGIASSHTLAWYASKRNDQLISLKIYTKQKHSVC